MSETFDKVCALVERGEIKVSEHGYDEMSDEDILARDVLAGVSEGIVVEDYPTYAKGPCVLVLQKDSDQRPIHVVWGIPKDLSSPAAVVSPFKTTPPFLAGEF